MTAAETPHPSPAGQFDLQGQTAVVTGSSRGIGRAIALELAAAGAHLVVHAGHDSAAAAKVAQEIDKLGRPALTTCCDVADSAKCSQLVQQAWDWRGGIDIWVNNAGADVLTGPAANYAFESKLARLWRQAL